MTYWQTYRIWLLNLLNERIFLSGRKGFKPELKPVAVELKRLVEFNGYRNDRTLASFLIRKSEQIEQLIPKNNAYDNQITVLRAAIAEGEGYIEYPNS